MYQERKIIFNKHHAQLPTILPLEDRLRIFYSTKNNDISTIRAIDVEIDDPSKIIEDRHVLGVGERGHFDDSGVMPSHILLDKSCYYLYYTGWYLRQSVPYGHAIGIAISNDGISFQRLGSILSISRTDPYLVNSGVLHNNILYYCSGNGWIGNFPTYHITTAIMKDKWIPTGSHIVGDPGEAVSRIAFEKNRIWFASRTKDTSYKIEYIENNVRCTWKEETCYPAFFREHMFYNGKGYGATGIWWAKWTK